MNKPPVKTFANTYIYTLKDESGHTTEGALLEFILKSERINKTSEAFASVLNDIKVRQTTAVLYRVLMMDQVVLCFNTKELPASFKVFTAKDLKDQTKKKKVFIDLTGLVKFKNGYFVCKETDKLCAYLMTALVNLLYYTNPAKITTNTSILRSSTICFSKLFCGVLDNLRVINYEENKTKIAYISAVYYLYNLVGKDIKSARSTAASVIGLPVKDASAYDIYYDEEVNFVSINSFIQFLAETFKLKDLTTNVYIARWIFIYGKGTMYGVELLPSFLSLLMNAFSGSYINNQKMIENICAQDMVDVSTMILRVGADTFDKGFTYDVHAREELTHTNDLSH